MSQQCSHCNNHDSSEHGSFLTGLTFGLFAGAAGYFLFGTNRGEKVRKAIEQEWEKAKEELAEEGVIESPEMSLGSMIRSVFESVAKQVGWEEENDSSSAKSKSKIKKKPTDSSKKNPKKFKGV